MTVEECSVSFLGTKVEVKMKKAEPGGWARLDIPKPAAPTTEVQKQEPKAMQQLADDVDDLDLDDLEILPTKAVLSKEASGGRTDREII